MESSVSSSFESETCYNGIPNQNFSQQLAFLFIIISFSIVFSLDEFYTANVFYKYSKFPLKGTGIFYQLDPSGPDQSHQTLDVLLIRMLPFVASRQSHHCSVNKTENQKKLLEMVYDQTQLRSKSSVIILKCTWIRLWSDQIRRKWSLIR